MTDAPNPDLDTAIAAVKAAFPDVSDWTAEMLAPHLPDHLRGPVWARMIDRYLAQELGDDYTKETR